jgi:TATA-binding protein-associated factor
MTGASITIVPYLTDFRCRFIPRNGPTYRETTWPRRYRLLSVLEAVAPTLHKELRPKLVTIFPMLNLALRSKFAIIRQSASRCFATICDVMTSEVMRFIVETIIPILGDPLVLWNRQGATELIYRRLSPLCALHCCSFCDRYCPEVGYKSTTYVIFMVVPVLGRMSDLDDDIRSTATNTFALLVKMVPLEVA